MISKGNKYMLAAGLAVGMALLVERPALAETLCNEYTVKKMAIVQVNDAGQCLVIVSVASGEAGALENRVVGDANGAVKLFGNYGTTSKLMAGAKFDADTLVLVKRLVKPENFASASAVVIGLHKAAKRDIALFEPRSAKLASEMSLANSLGWPLLPLEDALRKEYESVVLRSQSLDEVIDITEANIAKYATLLTNAGISPVTYLPIV